VVPVAAAAAAAAAAVAALYSGFLSLSLSLSLSQGANFPTANVREITFFRAISPLFYYRAQPVAAATAAEALELKRGCFRRSRRRRRCRRRRRNRRGRSGRGGGPLAVELAGVIGQLPAHGGRAEWKWSET